MPLTSAKLLLLLPGGVKSRPAGVSAAIAWRSERCSCSSRATAYCQAGSVRGTGAANQLDPFRGKEPRFSPSKRRRTAYFQ